MKETGILMSDPMVRALLREVDPKWQTRRTRGLGKLNNGYYRDRIGKVECRDGLWHFWEVGHGSSALPVFTSKCPYGVPGDRLWVREAWYDSRKESNRCPVTYRATSSKIDNEMCPLRWRPSIFMPRWASRITLEVTRVRVERVQEISADDAWAEGVGHLPGVGSVGAYETLWRTLNKEPGHRWEDNPWVWALSFKQIK